MEPGAQLHDLHEALNRAPNRPNGAVGVVSRWGRPVDAVPGPDGALYVSDDTAEAIYRLAPPTN
jgi:glucose/arabinose dehydrogenase